MLVDVIRAFLEQLSLYPTVDFRFDGMFTTKVLLGLTENVDVRVMIDGRVLLLV